MATTKPKKGDTVSLAFHYAGLVSWEKQTIAKMAKKGTELFIDESDFVHTLQKDGTFVNTDTSFGTAKRVIYTDGGKRAEKEAG